MRDKLAKPARILAETSARQHGVVTRAQLFAAGLTRSRISRWIEAGHLHRVHRGVYALGSPNLSREGYFMAAVLAVGNKAVLSHRSAAALHKLSPTCPPAVHVTVPGTSGRSRRQGIVLHRSRTLTSAETTRHRGIPVTTVARTLADLGWGRERTRSDLERLFLRICRLHGIPEPEVNVKVGPSRSTANRYHSDRTTFRTDRARDRDLGRRGFAVLRFADEELDKGPDTVAAAVLARL